MFSVKLGTGHPVGAVAIHIDGISGCSESGIMDKVRVYLAKRFGMMETQEDASTHVGPGIFLIAGYPFLSNTELWKKQEESARETQEEASTADSQLFPTSAELWNRRSEKVPATAYCLT